MFPVLDGLGPVAAQEGALLIEATLLMLIVIIPVIGLLFFFAWRYRKGSGARYEPEWEHSRFDELIWWAVPLEIVLVISALIWGSAHQLDPHVRPGADALHVQVVALPGAWLFIYPTYGIATVGKLTIPAGAPVAFDITADAPMNSFWIPALGSQIYAMTGMDTPLSLEASLPGHFEGMSANYSGDKFASMRFGVDALPMQDFILWADSMQNGTTTLDSAGYRALVADAPATAEFSSVPASLFNDILQKYMPPMESGHHH